MSGLCVQLKKTDTIPFGGWFLFDTLKGGPGLHGPCYNCEMVKRTYTNIADLFDDVPSKDQRISTETEPSSNEV
jgi:hypothetical protein